MNTTMMRIVLIAVVGLTPVAGSAQSQNQSRLPSVTVSGNTAQISYADIDTQTRPGFGELGVRINRAVRLVCSHYNGRVRGPWLGQECRSDAREDAWQQYAANEARRQYAGTDGRFHSAQGQVIVLAGLRPMDR